MSGFSVGLVSPATYNQSTGRPNQGPSVLLMPLTWPSVTAFLNQGLEQDRYQYQIFDDITDRDLHSLAHLDAVMFTAYTGHIYRAFELARQLRALAPSRQRFILGGIHATSIVFETIRAYLYTQLGKNPEIAAQLPDPTESRVVPLHRLLHRFGQYLGEGVQTEMLADPYAFFCKLGGREKIEELFANQPLPGQDYAREFFQLHEEFDVVFAGLLDGQAPSAESLQDCLIEAIESSQVPRKTILSLGFGKVDQVPRPNWKLCLGERSQKLFASPVSTAQSGRRTPSLSYETGRGCQHACDFCSVVNFFGPLAYKNTSLVYEDLRSAIVELGAYEFFFVDDNLNGSVKRFQQLCEALLPLRKEFPQFGWAAQLTFEHVAGHRDLMRLAAQAGMNSCYLGLEGVDTAAFEVVNKGHNTRDTVREGLRILKEEGIVAFCNVIMGLPTDDHNFPTAMLQGLKELDVPAIVPFTCSVLPGTALFNQLYASNDEDLREIMADGWKYNNSFDVVKGTRTLSKEQFLLVKREFVKRYSEYGRLLDISASYYKCLPWNVRLQDWIHWVGDFIQVVAFNQMVSDSLLREHHYMACGPHTIHPPTFFGLIRDSAWRRERGLGYLRAILLTLLTWLLPFIRGPVDKAARQNGIDLSWTRV